MFDYEEYRKRYHKRKPQTIRFWRYKSALHLCQQYETEFPCVLAGEIPQAVLDEKDVKGGADHG